MRDYRLFVYDENGHIVGPALVISAANDAEAIAQAEAVHGSLAAELLDFDGCGSSNDLPANGKASSEAAE